MTEWTSLVEWWDIAGGFMHANFFRFIAIGAVTALMQIGRQLKRLNSRAHDIGTCMQILLYFVEFRNPHVPPPPRPPRKPNDHDEG